MIPVRAKLFASIPFLLLLCAASNAVGRTPVSAEASPVLAKIYSFDFEGAIGDARLLQQSSPEDPIGYLLEAEALGWKRWCLAADFKYGFTDARLHSKLPSDKEYLDLAEKVSELAEKHLKQEDSARMEFYAGMGEALAARLYGLRGENRNVARAGVKARSHFLRALELDPGLADADFGIGLYNYYVDTLSAIAKILRFFMGIPGGSKEEGLRQLEMAVARGDLARQDASFYLALNLLKYDRQYEHALQIISPLAQLYPQNPLFQLLRGDCYAKLGRDVEAAESYRAAAEVPVADVDCAARIRELASAALASLQPPLSASRLPAIDLQPFLME